MAMPTTPRHLTACEEHLAVLAHLVEQRTRNAQVTGSTPVDGSFVPIV